ncbi:MAG TPA: hypothetical protein VNT79_00870, partial [Phycisphaerae bacterium]|nr:hypothetical protein [Phycisphaerae bacterium]
ILDSLERNFRGVESGVKDRRKMPPTEAEQPLLFSDEPGLPGWCSSLIDVIARVNVNETPPVEALRILQELKHLLQKNT